MLRSLCRDEMRDKIRSRDSDVTLGREEAPSIKLTDVLDGIEIRIDYQNDGLQESSCVNRSI